MYICIILNFILAAAKQQHAENIVLAYNETLTQIEAAIEATASGLVVSKEFLAEMVAELTFESVQDATLTAILEAQNATLR